MVLLDASIHLSQYLRLTSRIGCIRVGLGVLVDHIEVVTELIEFLLTKWCAKVDDKSDRQGTEDVCVQVLAQLRHAFNQLIFSSDKSMVFKMIHQILLSMFTQEVKLDLP